MQIVTWHFCAFAKCKAWRLSQHRTAQVVSGPFPVQAVADLAPRMDDSILQHDLASNSENLR